MRKLKSGKAKPATISADKIYKDHAKKLKQSGIINFDLRKKLTPQQKASITKKWADYRSVIEPKASKSTGRKKEYVTRTVSKKVSAELKKAGYKTFGNKVWIGKDRYKSVSIKSRKLKNGETRVEIVRKSRGKTSREKLYSKAGNIFADIEKAMETRKLMPNMFVSVKIGSNNPFSVNLPVNSYQELMNYLTKWQPKDDLLSRDELLSKMTLVYIND
ncbi:MAG: hypothetical protein V6Z81_10790 [Parvularculales bacterium]